MTLYIIGIGLWDEKDITVKGLEAIKKCDKVFLECYTSKLGVEIEKLEALYGKKIILADRELVEKRAEEIILPAKDSDVAFLVIGDAFGATTHTDIFLRAKKEGVQVHVIHNASVLNAVGIAGLELYKYGKTTSIPFANENVETPYNVIKDNKKKGMHTLVLLDIDANSSDNSTNSNRSTSNRYMTVNQGVEYLLRVEAKRKAKAFTPRSLCIGVARLGSDNPKIVCGQAKQLLKIDFGEPLHCIIVPGELHFVEEEALKQWS
jgi:diphthine methyl ester synthase